MGQQSGEKIECGRRLTRVPQELNSVKNAIMTGPGKTELEQLQNKERRMQIGLCEVRFHEKKQMWQDGLLSGYGKTVDCPVPCIQVLQHICRLKLREGQDVILVDAN